MAPRVARAKGVSRSPGDHNRESSYAGRGWFILPRQRFTCVPSMFDSLGVQIPYTT